MPPAISPGVDRTGALNTVKAAGLVFGDIGTSPIYTLTVILALVPRTEATILGVLSLIIWTLILIVTVQYAWLAMSLGKKGEGGTIVLRELLNPLLKSDRVEVRAPDPDRDRHLAPDGRRRDHARRSASSRPSRACP